MPKNNKRRSVGIQSTEFFNPEYQPPQQTRLAKRAGFKNLLRKSVTIVPHEHVEETDDVNLTREHRSRSIQADLDSSSFHRTRKPSQHYSPPVSRQERQTAGQSRQASYLGSINESEYSNPGTSRFIATQSSVSVFSQVERERYLQRQESSLVVVYSTGEKSRGQSLTSTHPHVQGSQGSRRLSDETVLLIEDYHSYDERNVARMQEMNRPRSYLCCFRHSRNETEVLSRPLPLQPTSSPEEDEKFCRICHEGSEDEPLMQPCLCKGSVGSVHARCLKAWLEQSSTSRCELCNYPYAIRQTRKYSTCVSVRVFYKSVFDKRAAAYDVTSFIIITPLTLVGVVMCIKASLFTKASASGESSHQMSYVTKVGMIMLSGTIIIAYLVWLYTLASFHYKAWKKWYNTCYDVEVIPVQMSSEERLLAAREFSEEQRVYRGTAEYSSPILAVPRSSHRQFYRAPAIITNPAIVTNPATVNNPAVAAEPNR